MKYLSDYLEPELKVLYKKHDAFYAFNKNQYEAEAKPGVDYVSLGFGLHVARTNVDAFKSDYKEVLKKCIAQDIEENGKVNVIRREYNNYEYDIDQTIYALKGYPMTEDEIRKECGC